MTPLFAGSCLLVTFLTLARHPSLITLEMDLGSLVRDPRSPTSFITRAKGDGRSCFPPGGGKQGSLAVRRAVDATLGSPRGDPKLAYS